MTPEQAQALTDAVAHYNDGLITAYELIIRLDVWRRDIDLHALLAEHERIFASDPDRF